MFVLTNTEKFITVFGSVLAGLGVIVHSVRSIANVAITLVKLGHKLDSFMVQHEKDHARMDGRVDRIELGLSDHIGRHRRY